MVSSKFLEEYNVSEPEIQREASEIMGEMADAASLAAVYQESIKDFAVGSILKGKVVAIYGDDVIVDVGYKSEGTISLDEFDAPRDVKPEDEIEVLLESVEDESGLIVLSKRKADRIRGWERIFEQYKEGDTVTGRVSRKIKGGLLVDIGVPVFMPASQVDIRRPSDVGDYIGREIECKILKIDQGRRNIVVSRRRLLEDERSEAKGKLMEEIEVGQKRTGVVKNVTDFGAFVDLGGIDGLLHVTDMSWSRISHPSDMVHPEQTIEVLILNVDRAKEKIALGLKQLKQSPWENVEEKYPVGSRVTGEVVNIMPYGAFVKLEDGVEGLVHISEMSWTKRLNHPTEVVATGETIDTIVLDINKEKEEISLGMKQTEINPWSLVREKYPPGTIVEGIVRNVTNYGAFVAIEDGIDALLHVSDISWTKKVNHPSEVLKKGGSLKAVVLSVDQDKRRIAIGLKQLEEDPWERKIPEKYVPGGIVKGTVTKITNFGVFVELEAELEGLLHISELADHKIEQPEDIVQLGQEIEVKVLRVDNEDRKIGLSLKRVQWAAEEAEAKGEKKQEPKEDQERLGGIQSDTEAPAEGRNDVLFGTAIPRIARSVVETQPEEDVEETPAEQPTDAAEETEVKPAEQPTDADEETEVKPAEQPTDAGEEAVVTPAEQPLDADNKTELLETAEASEEAEDNAVDEKPEADDNNSSPA